MDYGAGLKAKTAQKKKIATKKTKKKKKSVDDFVMVANVRTSNSSFNKATM